MGTLKIAIIIAACALLCFMGTALAYHDHDWLSPGGAGPVHHTDRWGFHGTWYNPAPTYYYGWYNYFDPWWYSNFFGPYRAIYRWTYWGW